MKKTQTAAHAAHSPMPALRQQRQAVMDEREALVAKLHELNAKVESLDSVMTMFDPTHVPIEIRGMRVEAPILTVEARPTTMLLESEVRRTEKAAMAAVGKTPKKAAAAKADKPGKGGRKAKQAPVAPAAATEPPVIAVEAAGKKRRQTKEAAGTTSADNASPTEAAGEAAGRKKRRTQPEEASAADNSEAIAKLRNYFDGVDKLETLKGIITERPEGVPLRDIVNGFVAKHPVDLDDARFNKLFRNRISTILNTLSSQGKVVRDVVEGDGKRDGIWKAAPGWQPQEEAAA